MKTLYVSDIDGTLTDDNGKLSAYTISTINALVKRGLPLTLNTSRTPQSAKEILSQLELELPVILMNGSCIFNTKTGKAEVMRCIEKPLVNTAINICISCGLQPFLFDYKNGDVSLQYTAATTPASLAFLKRRREYYAGINKVDFFSVKGEVPYIVCAGERNSFARAAEKLSRVRGLSFSHFFTDETGLGLLEIYAENAGKKNATELFAKTYGFDKITAFGDNLNDAEMLKFADTGVVVANGYNGAKEAADICIGTAQSNAVADYLLVEWSRNLEMY